MRGKLKLPVPPGRDSGMQLTNTALALGAVFLWSLGAPLDMHRSWQAVVRAAELGTRYTEPTLSGTLGTALYGFAGVALGMAVLAIRNYLSLREGSRADYLARRLPNRWERHIWCLAVPIVGALASAILAAALYFLYRGYFFYCRDAARAVIASL